MTTDPLRHSERDGRWLIVQWEGDVDMANASTLEQHTLALVENTDEGVTIDLSYVDYIDSAGIRSLVGIRRLLEERQQRLTMIVPEGSLLNKALQVGGITALIPTYTGPEEARAARPPTR